MYCPKCGEQNSDDLAYCRKCGEDVKIISQVMKGHAPLAIASKLDAAIDTSRERFRRDAILWVFWATIYIVSILVKIYTGAYGNSGLLVSFLFTSFPSFIMLALAAWNALLYRRSKQLAQLSPRSNETYAHIGADVYFAEGETTTDGVFCPRCGRRNLVNAAHCTQCGLSLAFSLDRKKTQADSYFTRELDASLREKERSGSRTVPQIILGALFWLFLAFLQAFIAGNWFEMAFYILLASTRTFVNIWDLLHFRRKQENPSRYVPTSADIMAGDPNRSLESTDKMLTADQIGFESKRKSIKRARVLYKAILVSGVFLVFPVSSILLMLQWGEHFPLVGVIGIFVFGLISIVVGWRGLVIQKRAAAELAENIYISNTDTAKLEAETQRQLNPINAQGEIAQSFDVKTQTTQTAVLDTKPLGEPSDANS